MRRDDNFLKELSFKIRRIRNQKGISIEKLAYQIEMPFSQVARIERGEVNPTIQPIKDIADELKVGLSEFLQDA